MDLYILEDDLEKAMPLINEFRNSSNPQQES
jgi:hypothetical protein